MTSNDVDMSVHITTARALREDWERSGWAGLPREVFDALVTMFPTVAQELGVFYVEQKSGKTYCFLSRREPNDKYYGGLFHGLGSSSWSRDSVNASAKHYDPNLEFLNEQVVAQEKAKPTWHLDARGKALVRLLTGREINLSVEKAIATLSEIHSAGWLPVNWKRRGPEANHFNVWLPSLDVLKGIGTPIGCKWVNVTQLRDMERQGKLMRHHVAFLAKMVSYIRANIDPRVPELARL